MTSSRHCEERSDAAIQGVGGMDCFAGRHCEEQSDAAVAMTKVGRWILRANTGPVLSQFVLNSRRHPGQILAVTCLPEVMCELHTQPYVSGGT